MLEVMKLLTSVFLGIIQGATEFLPVSSSGHLALFKDILQVAEVPVLYDVLLHVSTLLVVLLFFRHQIVRIVRSTWRYLFCSSREQEDSDGALQALVIIIATLFTGGIGLFVAGLGIERNLQAVSVLFICTGILLLSTRFLSATYARPLSGWHGVLLGIAQGLGTLPGVSRSGITISAALIGGLEKKRAAELSFLLSVPAIMGALLLELPDLTELSGQMSPLVLIAGCVSAAVTGLLALKLLMWLIGSGRIYLFAIYLLPLGVISLILL